MPVPMKARKSMASYKASRKVTPYIRANQTVRRYIPAAIGRGLNRRGQTNKETGYVDVAATTYNFDTTGSIVLLNTVSQGAGTTQRVGKKIMLKSLQCRGYCYNSTTAVYNDCAILIVYDKRPTGALPAITDILNTANAVAFNNDVNSGRFKILKRADFMLIGPQTGAIATQQLTSVSSMSADFFLDLKGLPEVFKAAGTGAIGDIEEGAMYLVTVGITAAGTAAAHGVLGFRLRFVDV